MAMITIDENKGHLDLLKEEVADLLDKLQSLGNTAHAKMPSEDIEDNWKWNELLDRFFDEVCEFAEERGVCPM